MALLMRGDELVAPVRVVAWKEPARLILELEVELAPGAFELVDEFGAQRPVQVTWVSRSDPRRAEARLV